MRNKYVGPYRRQNDLPAQNNSKRSVRLSTVNIIMSILAFLTSTFLAIVTFRKEQIINEILVKNNLSNDLLSVLIIEQVGLTIILIVILISIVLSIFILVLKPLNGFIKHIYNHEMLPMNGAYEIQYLAKAYNIKYEETERHNQELVYKAEHDALTGLYNRGAFDKLYEANKAENMAMLIIDIDNFKSFNDNYGHEVGDKVLKKVANALNNSFRASDYTCRIGGDEFSVIMPEIRVESKQVIVGKIERIKDALMDTSDNLPTITISIGIAFKDGDKNIFNMADKALYYIKDNGRNSYVFYDELTPEYLN